MNPVRTMRTLKRSKKAHATDANLCLHARQLHWSLHNNGFSESAFSLQIAKAPADIKHVASTFYNAKIDDVVDKCESDAAFRDGMARFIAYLKR
jgi:hypothetical protein